MSATSQLDWVEIDRIRRTAPEIPTDPPLYSLDEVAAILADLGVDSETSAGRSSELEALIIHSYSHYQCVLLALAYREIDKWERAPRPEDSP
jgi:hypothetical protein